MQSRLAYVASKTSPDDALKSFMGRWRARSLSEEEKTLIKDLITKADLKSALQMAEQRGEKEVADLIRQYQERYGAMELAHQKLVADVGPLIGKYLGGGDDPKFGEPKPPQGPPSDILDKNKRDGGRRKRKTRKSKKSRRITRRR
jgi:hypothetical protein